MNFKIFTLYNLGALILFLGLLWMFLPHATHESILDQVEQEGASHLSHTIHGAIAAVIGLVIMGIANHIQDKNNKKKKRRRVH